MSNIFILNGHQPYPFAKGELNATFVDRAARFLTDQGHDLRITTLADGYDVEAEIGHHQWADIVIMQFPVNWMMAS